ncbi:MAG: hypothetical protein H7340_13315 [Variovorax sp.]|nr:hypothetical protein [Variovorax sp.]
MKSSRALGPRRKSFSKRFREFIVQLWPARARVDSREWRRAVRRAGIGILVTVLVSHWLAGIVISGRAVSVGALVQPWAVVGGHVLSGLAGSACGSLIPDL